MIDYEQFCRIKAYREEGLKEKLNKRMREVGLELHPEKTKIVYCKDDDRQEDYPCTSFDFLGYTFRARRSKNRWGKHFINFTPAISNKAAKTIRQTSRRWRWPERSDKDLENLARMFNPIIQGWINYYGRYYKSALYPTLTCLNRRLVMWATRKYIRLRGHRHRAGHWLDRKSREDPCLPQLERRKVSRGVNSYDIHPDPTGENQVIQSEGEGNDSA